PLLTDHIYSPMLINPSQHSYRHAIPTRRSSDLGRGPGGSAGELDRRGGRRGHPGEGRMDVNAPEDPPLRARLEALLLVVDQQQRDRKSTRLNSSHGSISYAVFCLKKKKKA